MVLDMNYEQLLSKFSGISIIIPDSKMCCLVKSDINCKCDINSKVKLDKFGKLLFKLCLDFRYCFKRIYKNCNISD